MIFLGIVALSVFVAISFVAINYLRKIAFHLESLALQDKMKNYEEIKFKLDFLRPHFEKEQEFKKEEGE